MTGEREIESASGMAWYARKARCTTSERQDAIVLTGLGGGGPTTISVRRVDGKHDGTSGGGNDDRSMIDTGMEIRTEWSTC